MKSFLPLTLAAAAFSFTACDKEKVDEAKTKTVEAAKSVGEATKDATGKALEKSGELLQKAGDKLKGAGEKLKDNTEKLKESAEKMKEAASQKLKDSPALESFKTRLSGFSTMMINMKGQAGSDFGKAKGMINDLMAKLNTVSTDGVPPDVAKAFEDYRATMTRVLKFTMNAPADPAAQEKYFTEHADEGHQIEKETSAASKALREAAAKHGLENLELGDGEK